MTVINADEIAADLTAALDGIRDRAGAVAKLGPPLGGALANATAASAADVPRLLAAVEAVLAFHRPGSRRRKGHLVCGQDSELWPCLHVLAISRALTEDS